MPREPKQWENCVAVILKSHRADCGHACGTALFRFRVDAALKETYSLCGHCAADADKDGITVYRYRPGTDKRPYAVKRIELL